VVAELACRSVRIRACCPLARKAASRVLRDMQGLVFAGSADEALHGSAALAIVTERNEFRTPDFEAINAGPLTSVVFDGRTATSRR